MAARFVPGLSTAPVAIPASRGPNGAEVMGQRTLGKGRPGKRHDPHAVPDHPVEQLTGDVARPLHPGGGHVAGIHAEGGVHRQHDVHPDQRHFLFLPSPLRARGRGREQENGAQQQEVPEPAAGSAVSFDEGRRTDSKGG